MAMPSSSDLGATKTASTKTKSNSIMCLNNLIILLRRILVLTCCFNGGLSFFLHPHGSLCYFVVCLSIRTADTVGVGYYPTARKKCRNVTFRNPLHSGHTPIFPSLYSFSEQFTRFTRALRHFPNIKMPVMILEQNLQGK